MNENANAWPLDAFDAIGISAPDCKVNLRGTDREHVELKDKFDRNISRDLSLEPAGRWLMIHSSHMELTLELPGSKAWILSVSSGRGDVEVSNITARLQVVTGKGNISISKMKGAISVRSGHANIQVKHFIQAEMPEPPPRSQEAPPPYKESHWAGPGWLRWSENEWKDWGEDLGDKIGRRAMDLGSWFGHFNGNRITGRGVGIDLQTAAGNIEVEDIEARAGTFKLLRGNLQMKEVDGENLEINLTSGNIKGESVAPSGRWKIKSIRGNVHLSLPSDIGARLDMATRSGNINSEIPLVRVARQGPESCAGSRMVGTIGPVIEGKMPELYISTVRGNIDIKSSGAAQKNNRQAIVPQPEGPDDQMKILTALQEGKINVEEADRLLRSLGS